MGLDWSAHSMTSLLGWVIITTTFASLSMGLFYPGYRLARRAYPESRRIWLIYVVAAALFSIVLWLLLPVLVHQFFGRGAH
jgi:uncharacterized membrane-anchored protein